MPSLFAEYKTLKLPRPKQFGLDDIEAAVSDLGAVINLQAEAFKAHSNGMVSTPPVQSMGQPPFHPFVAGHDAQTCVKSGYFHGDECYVIKIAPGGVRANEEQNMPINTGLNLLFSQRTTRLEAIFFDEGLLTEIRTAAAAALAARVLAPLKDLTAVGLIGAGVQAKWQLRLLAPVTSCRRALVSARDPARVARFCAEMAAEGWQVEQASPQEIATRCRLIHTSTNARESLLKKEWFVGETRGTHISAMGADTPGKQELDPALVASADLLVCDCRKQTFDRGEFQTAAARGLLADREIQELGEVLQKPSLQRGGSGDGRLTIFDSSGIAAQDIAITKAVYEALMSTQRSSL